MKCFIGYASIEGQSRKIARWIADRACDQGHCVELMTVGDAHGLDLSRFDAGILVASVHANHYSKAFVKFIEEHAECLAATPVLFASVSLAAAGHDAEDWRGLRDIAKDVSDATGWTPANVIHVAGAYKPSEYDLLTRFIMRRIIAEKDPDAAPGDDKEYTDWDQLAAMLDDWVLGAAP